MAVERSRPVSHATLPTRKRSGWSQRNGVVCSRSWGRAGLAPGRLERGEGHHLDVVAVGPGGRVQVAHVVVAPRARPGRSRARGRSPPGSMSGQSDGIFTTASAPQSPRRPGSAGRAGPWGGREDAATPSRRAELARSRRRPARCVVATTSSNGRRGPRARARACAASSGRPRHRGISTLPGSRVEPRARLHDGERASRRLQAASQGAGAGTGRALSGRAAAALREQVAADRRDRSGRRGRSERAAGGAAPSRSK